MQMTKHAEHPLSGNTHKYQSQNSFRMRLLRSELETVHETIRIPLYI